MDARIDRLRLIVPRLGDSTKNLGDMKSHTDMGEKRHEGSNVCCHVIGKVEILIEFRVIVHIACPSRRMVVCAQYYHSLE